MPSAYSRCGGRGTPSWHRRRCAAPAFHRDRRSTRPEVRCECGKGPGSNGGARRDSRDLGRADERAEVAGTMLAGRLDVDRPETGGAELYAILVFFERPRDASAVLLHLAPDVIG